MAMKYRKGDIVIFYKSIEGLDYKGVKEHLGQKGTITTIYNNDEFPYLVKFKDEWTAKFSGQELMLADKNIKLVEEWQ